MRVSVCLCLCRCVFVSVCVFQCCIDIQTRYLLCENTGNDTNMNL